MAKVAKRYDIKEVGAILKVCQEKKIGHSENLHSMGGAGRRRAKINDEELAARNLEEASAYMAGCQIYATQICLNSDIGQKALQALDNGNKRVVIKISFHNNPGIQMRAAIGETWSWPGYKGLTTVGNLGYVTKKASHGVVVCEKSETGLIIITSYPLSSPPQGFSYNQSDYEYF